MKERYEGANSKRLVEAIADQELVNHNRPIAEKLAKKASLQDLQEGKQLYVRGEPGKNSLYLILSGSVDLSVQGRHVATRTSKQCIGEFPILDSGLSYTVTAVAREPSVVAAISEKNLLAVADEHPAIWRNMARMLVERLYGTSKTDPGSAASNGVKPGDLTITQIWRGLSVGQLWAVIAALFSLLAAVASASYKLGSVFR
jgi:hypothetical protein